MAALQERQAEVVNEEEEEQQGGPFPIEALQEVGVAAADIKKLKEGGEQRPAKGCSSPRPAAEPPTDWARACGHPGIHTIESLSYASKRELSDIKGMSDAKVVKLKEAGAQGQSGCPRWVRPLVLTSRPPSLALACLPLQPASTSPPASRPQP